MMHSNCRKIPSPPWSVVKQCDSVRLIKPLYGLPKSLIEKRQGRVGNCCRHTSVKRFRDPARNARQCISVPSKGNRQPHSIFVVLGFEKRDDRLGDGFLAGLVERIRLPDNRRGPAQIITKLCLDHTPNLSLGVSLPAQECRCSRGLCSSNPFWMVVSHFRTGSCLFEHLV